MPDDDGKRKVNDEDLNEERRAADEVHVNLRNETERRELGELCQGRHQTENQAESHGKGSNFQRYERALQQKGQRVGNERKVKFHWDGSENASVERSRNKRVPNCE